MTWRPQHPVELDRCHAVRTILVTLAPFVLDDLALAVDAFGRHRIEQVSHPIRFEEEGELEGVCRQVDEVIRSVRVGGTVVRAACSLEQRIERALRDMPRSLEHQVLEQMCQPGAASALIRGPYVVPDVHADHRYARVSMQ